MKRSLWILAMLGVASLLTLDAWEGRGPTLRHRHLSRSRVSRSALLRLGGGGGACPSATRLWGGRLLPLWGGGGDYGDDDGSCPGWPSRLRGGGGKDADEGEGEVDGNIQEESGDLDEDEDEDGDEDEDEDEGDVLDLGGEEGAVRGDVPDDAPEECPGTSSNMAGKSASCDGCPNQGACSSGDARQAEMAVEEATRARMGGVKHKLLVLSGKGGVGKSTLSVQLAMALSKGGSATGILDVDVCGPSVPRMVGAEDQEVRQAASGWQPVWVSDTLCVMSIGFMLPSRNEAVVWRGARKNGLITQFVRDVDWGELEYLVVDSPPGTSDEHITLAKLMKGSEGVSAIIVTTPQEIALLDVRKEINFCEKAGCRVLGVVENMCGFQCPNCNHVTDILPPSGEDSKGATLRGGEAMAKALGVPFLGRVPMDPSLSRAGEAGMAVSADSPSSKSLLEVVESIKGRLDHDNADAT